jgi:hypothetical protein
MHYDILDEHRRALLPTLAGFKGKFYLAGGTALALQIGHRDSIDFDFFCLEPFDTARLFEECVGTFASHTIVKTQDEQNTLGILIDNSISITFMAFPYPLARPLVESEHLNLASIEDIACMKFSATTGRSRMKDYVDLYSTLHLFSLASLLVLCAQKLPTLDRNLILKSLVYFGDVTPEPIRFMPGHEVDFKDLQDFLEGEVKKVL